MTTPLVSVLTPAYNAGSYLAQTIEGVLNQTYENFEFIIINDCSTDNTYEIAKSYAEKDRRVRLVDNKENLGIAGNRNKAISLAKGEYIVWQDADDISVPTRIEKQVAFMENHPEVGICGGYLRFFDSTGVLGVRKYEAEDRLLRQTIFRFSPVAQPAAIIRKSAVDYAGKYDLAVVPAEDLDMSFRIGIKYKFANIPEVLVEYREHPNSATFSKLKKMELNTIKIRNKYANAPGYCMTVADKLYNFAHFASIFIIPPRTKIWLFSKIRNSK